MSKGHFWSENGTDMVYTLLRFVSKRKNQWSQGEVNYSIWLFIRLGPSVPFPNMLVYLDPLTLMRLLSEDVFSFIPKP